LLLPNNIALGTTECSIAQQHEYEYEYSQDIRTRA
jgi:hypothetical protein